MRRDLKEVFDIAGLKEEPIEESIKDYIGTPLPPNELAKSDEPSGVELSSLSIFMRNSDKRSLFTFIELEGYPILRITIDGKCEDLILNNDQVKLLLRQMTLWLTR